MAEPKTSFWRRHRWLAWTTGGFLVTLAVIGCSLAVIAHELEPFLRARLIQSLQDRFRTRVELDQFHVALGNGLHGEWGIWANGEGLRIWPPQRTGGDHPLEVATQSLPLIQLKEFRFHAPLRYQPDKPLRIALVRLEGLSIHIPPRSERDKTSGFDSAVAKSRASAASRSRPAQAGVASHFAVPRQPAQPNTAPAHPSTAPSAGGLTQDTTPSSSNSSMINYVVVERIECTQADLVLETDKPDKLPLEFAIAHLNLTHVTAGGAMGFEAELTNPKPQGLIHTTGSVGPWLVGDPGQTALTGSYRFDHADLSTFKGIAGILASTGKYQGTLSDLVVDGQADVPDFRLTHFGNSMPLHTTFHATVDGTDGDTWLDPVEATLGRSHFSTRGKVVRVKPSQASDLVAVSGPARSAVTTGGHDIDLTVNVDHGYIDDFLRLASRSPTTLMTGNINLTASLHIPPGKEPVHQRIQLEGFFKLDDAHFNSEKIQDKIRDLSLRGQGRPKELKSDDVARISSEMQGSFHLANAVLTLPDLEYNVPGAAIRLSGKYELDGFMNFSGTARMDATVSQMVGGWKGFLLKPVDRFFKKDGAGTLVPIEIRGSHDAPEFSVDFGRLKNTSPQTPGQKQP